MVMTTDPIEITPPQRSTGAKLASWALVLALLSVVASALIGFWSIERSKRLERNAADKVSVVENDSRDLKFQLKAATEQLREVAARQSLAEAKLSDALSQQGQLEKQYQELVRSRSDAQLADIEVSIAGAAQQLQFSGNVRSALLAMQDADSRLERMNQPPLLGVRRLLGKDIERLRQVQVADTMVLATKVDYLIDTVPQMRLISEPARDNVQGNAVGNSGKPSSTNSTGAAPFFQRLSTASEQGWSGLKREILQLFRVQKLDSNDALLVSPEQAFFIRENLKLRLNSLRGSLMARNQAAVKRDADAAIDMLQKYFDQQHSAYLPAQNSLKELGAAPVSVELPNLNETLALVRTLRSKDVSRDASKDVTKDATKDAKN
jgi:uroporphyrin-III C-methyltransferase